MISRFRSILPCLGSEISSKNPSTPRIICNCLKFFVAISIRVFSPSTTPIHIKVVWIESSQCVEADGHVSRHVQRLAIEKNHVKISVEKCPIGIPVCSVSWLFQYLLVLMSGDGINRKPTMPRSEWAYLPASDMSGNAISSKNSSHSLLNSLAISIRVFSPSTWQIQVKVIWIGCSQCVETDEHVSRYVQRWSNTLIVLYSITLIP